MHTGVVCIQVCTGASPVCLQRCPVLSIYAYIWYIHHRKLYEAALKVAKAERDVVEAELDVLKEEDATALQLAKAER